MSALRLGDLAEMVFLFMRLDVFPGSLDLFVARDAKAIMIVEGFLRRVGAAFVNDQAPIGIRMFQRRFAGLLLDDFHRQQIGEDRQGLGERAAFIVAGDQSGCLKHGSSPDSKRCKSDNQNNFSVTFQSRAVRSSNSGQGSTISSFRFVRVKLREKTFLL